MKTVEGEVIQLTQAPIIEYAQLEAIKDQVKSRIDELKLNELEISESTLKEIKGVRAQLNKEFNYLEERRKLVKDLIMQPYYAFEAAYKDCTAPYPAADAFLKNAIKGVEDKRLEAKIEGLRKYFDSVNEYDFITFEDVPLKVTASTSDSTYQLHIDEYLKARDKDLRAIATMKDYEKVLVKYRLYKDLGQALAQMNMEEAQAAKLAQAKAEVATAAPAPAKEEAKEEQPAPEPAAQEDTKVYKATFTVHGTKDQLRRLKAFMIEEGLTYE